MTVQVNSTRALKNSPPPKKSILHLQHNKKKYIIYIYIYTVNQYRLKILAQERFPGPRWVLHVFQNIALESKKGGHTFLLDYMARGSWARSYQCCRGADCSNWIWEDKVAEGYVCRKCGLAWRQPAQGFRDRSKSQPRNPSHPRLA